MIDIKDISKVILLKAITSAPAPIDINNILNSIEKAENFETYTPDHSQKTLSVWHALLVTKEGEYIQYLSDGEWIQITLERGSGFFRWNRKA